MCVPMKSNILTAQIHGMSLIESCGIKGEDAATEIEGANISGTETWMERFKLKTQKVKSIMNDLSCCIYPTSVVIVMSVIMVLAITVPLNP